MTTHRELATQLQGKFEFYFLSLTFTLLAASVQTANLQRSHTENLLELGGWLGLLVAGIVGMSRMEWLPVTHQAFAHLDQIRQERDQLDHAQRAGMLVTNQAGEFVDPRPRIGRLDETRTKLDERTKKLQRKAKLKYDATRLAFVIGLVAILASRSVEAVLDLFGYRPL